MSDPSFLEVLDSEALPEGALGIVEAAGRRIGLARFRGRIHAFDNACPHLGGSLGRGTLKGGCVVCPLHHWSFDLATGKCVDGLPMEKITVFEVKEEAGKVFLRPA